MAALYMPASGHNVRLIFGENGAVTFDDQPVVIEKEVADRHLLDKALEAFREGDVLKIVEN